MFFRYINCQFPGAGRMAAILAGVLAALLQAGGYLLYARGIGRGEVEPNAASWFMFAYGTALVLVVEAVLGGAWHQLLLPGVCAAASIGIAASALRRAASWHLDGWDSLAFGLDVLLTLAYLGAYALGALATEASVLLGSIVLIGTGATTVTSFVPILRATYREPSTESAAPWIVWTAAYAVLLAASAWTGGPPALLIYPGICLVLHGLMALLSLPSLRLWMAL